MGAAPLLIMLAAVGVDYGWQPDGTTSPRGDNLEYIVQISPEQLDQIKSIGEITSAIDPEIQGRVSRMVVRVGTGKLPRNAGRSVPLSTASDATDVGDLARIPIPEIDEDLRRIAQTQVDRGASPGSEAMMKPDPQAGGFALPDSLSSPVRTNPAVSTDPATNRDNQWSDIGTRSSTTSPGTGALGTAATGTGGTGASVGTAARGPSTDPVDPAARSTAWPSAAPQAGASSFGTTPAAASSASPSSSSTAAAGTRRPTDPSDPNWSGYGTTPNFGTLPPGMNSGQSSLQNTAPQSAGLASGTGTSSAAIGFPQTMPTAADLSRQANDLQRSVAGQIDSAAGAAQTFARDASGNLLDRLGRPIDSLGRLIDPETGFLVDGAGNWIDQQGRRIDRLGRPLPGEFGVAMQGTSVQQGNPANLQAPPLANQRNDAGFQGGFQNVAQPNTFVQGQGPLVNQPQFQQQNAANQQFGNQQFAGQTFGNQQFGNPQFSNPQNPNQPLYNQQSGYGQSGFASSAGSSDPRFASNDNSYGRARRGFDEDDLRSSSDSRLAVNDRAATNARVEELELARQAALARQVAVTTTKTRTVAAQPFFNFVLLISLVGNAYLIFETGNLRRKFKNMIANVRATKISPQPAN